jgi:ABC-type methionine transport system permease subunit
MRKLLGCIIAAIPFLILLVMSFGVISEHYSITRFSFYVMAIFGIFCCVYLVIKGYGHNKNNKITFHIKDLIKKIPFNEKSGTQIMIEGAIGIGIILSGFAVFVLW